MTIAQHHCAGGIGRDGARFILRYASLISAAIFTVSVAGGAASAQEVIDGGATVSVPGTQATPWNFPDDLFVGDATTGTLNIGATGIVTDFNSRIGNQGGSNGAVNVTSGGQWTNISGYVGYDSGSTGTVIVDGAGSRWTSTGLFIGDGGEGHLTISNGGWVEDNVGHIAASPGSVGTATITGTGSIWHNSDSLVVGGSGTATMNVLAGGNVDDTEAILGYSVGSTGTATVDGAGSRWTNTADVIVGNQGTGNLTVSNGGAVSAHDSGLGLYFGSTGTATITGVGSNWTTSTDLAVGIDGTGTLNILAGGVVNDGTATVATTGGSHGAVRVDGTGSIWSTSTLLDIGNGGTGTLTVSNGGTVNSTDAILGDYATGVGTATVTGTGSAWYSGDISIGNVGTGTLSILNGGTVSDNHGYIGEAATGIGSVRVDGALSTWYTTDLDVGDGGKGALTISNGGQVFVSGALTVADQAGSTGVLNIGAAAGLPAVAAGVLNAATLQFGAGTGTLNFNHTETAYAFAPVISGAGTIEQRAGNTILTANSNGFTGATKVTGGRLAVNGSLASSTVTVSGGGILGGNGTVGGIVVQSGGVAGPGNSIGTLNVAGNVGFAAGSVYQVETNPAGQSDKIVATGIASLSGGTVQVLTGAGAYGASTQYTILTAAGGVVGAFAGVTADFIFLTPSLSYDPNSVFLSLDRNANTFAEVGSTPNQQATGGAVEPLGAGNPIYDAVLKQNVSTARGAFDQLSGEIHASIKGVMIEDSRFVREAALDRLRSSSGGVGAPSAPVTTYVDGNPVLAAATTDRFAVWGRGFGSWGQWDGDGNAATSGRDVGGLFVGADGRVADTWRVGAIGGYSRSTFNVGARNSSGESDDYHAGLYGGSSWGNLALRSGLAYSWHDISTNRSVAFPGFADALQAGYSAGTAQAFGELGYGLLVEQLLFEPFANLAYVQLSTDGFTETGGAAALSSQGGDTSATFTTLGLRGSTSFALDNGATLTARGTLGWRHAFGDTTPVAAMAFAGGSPFNIGGVPIAGDVAVVETGLDVNFARDATLGLTYGGQFGSGVIDQSVLGNLNVNF